MNSGRKFQSGTCSGNVRCYTPLFLNILSFNRDYSFHINFTCNVLSPHYFPGKKVATNNDKSTYRQNPLTWLMLGPTKIERFSRVKISSPTEVTKLERDTLFPRWWRSSDWSFIAFEIFHKNKLVPLSRKSPRASYLPLPSLSTHARIRLQQKAVYGDKILDNHLAIKVVAVKIVTCRVVKAVDSFLLFIWGIWLHLWDFTAWKKSI